MTQKNSGETSSSPPSAESRIDELDVELARYESSLGLPARCPAAIENESTRLLELPPQTLKRMTSRECSEAAFTLTQYAFYLQRAANFEQSRVRWAEASSKRMVAASLPGQRASAFEERLLLALRGNPAAMKVESLRVCAQLRLDRVSFLAARVESMARCLTSLGYHKRESDERD